MKNWQMQKLTKPSVRIRGTGLRWCSTEKQAKNEKKSDGEGQITKILMYVVSPMLQAPFQRHKPRKKNYKGN